MEVLQVLFDPILPIFAIMAFGFGMGKAGKTSFADARMLNRFAMSVLLPVYLFNLIANAPILTFSFAPVLVYSGTQIVVFTVGYLLAFHVFKRSAAESILLGFCGIFSNTVMYILPISLLLYGETAVLPITTVVTLDSTLTFGGAMIALQVVNLGKVTIPTVAFSILRTPLLQALALGVLFSLVGIAIPAPVKTFVSFTGAAAAPVALYALGVVLSQTQFCPNATVWTFTIIKMVILPVTIWVGMETLIPNEEGRNLFLLASAGPAGAMALSLAMLHDVRTDAIAQVIIITSILTLFSLAMLA